MRILESETVCALAVFWETSIWFAFTDLTVTDGLRKWHFLAVFKQGIWDVLIFIDLSVQANAFFVFKHPSGHSINSAGPQ